MFTGRLGIMVHCSSQLAACERNLAKSAKELAHHTQVQVPGLQKSLPQNKQSDAEVQHGI